MSIQLGHSELRAWPSLGADDRSWSREGTVATLHAPEQDVLSRNMSADSYWQRDAHLAARLWRCLNPP